MKTLPLKVGVLTLAYNEEKFIGANVRQFKPYGLEHLVLVSNTPWHGDHFVPDRTKKIAEDEGARVIVGDWKSEAEQRNFGLQQFEDYDWVLIVDADEFYDGIAMSLLSDALQTEMPIICTENMEVYWKDMDHRVTPKQEDMPIIAVSPNIRFHNKRQAYGATMVCSATLHHLSYVRDDHNMWKKINAFEHANEFDTLHWFSNVWLDWTEDMTELHPVNPPQFQKAVHNPLPEDLRALFNASI